MSSLDNCYFTMSCGASPRPWQIDAEPTARSKRLLIGIGTVTTDYNAFAIYQNARPEANIIKAGTQGWVYFNLLSGELMLDPFNSKTKPYARNFKRGYVLPDMRRDASSFLAFNITLNDKVTRQGYYALGLTSDMLELQQKSEKLPCKILAWLNTGTAMNALGYIKSGSGSRKLPEDATLLIMCGTRLVTATRKELEALVKKQAVKIIPEVAKAEIEIVYMGEHPAKVGTQRLSYKEGFGIVCDYTGLDFLYTEGTLDCTPHTAINTELVKRPSPYPCALVNLQSVPNYTHLDLQECKITDAEYAAHFKDTLMTNLVSYKMPNTVTVIPKGHFRKSSRLESLELSHSLTDLGIYLFDNMPIKKLFIPKSVAKLDFDAQIPTEIESLVIENPFTELINNIQNVFPHLSNLFCTPNILYELSLRQSLSKMFPNLKYYNNTPLAEIKATYDDASCLLNGLGAINW